MAERRESLEIAELSVEAVNRALAIIREQLDDLKGLRNAVVIYDNVVAQEAAFQVKDENGTVIHQLGGS